jgi:hypothetical protein
VWARDFGSRMNWLACCVEKIWAAGVAAECGHAAEAHAVTTAPQHYGAWASGPAGGPGWWQSGCGVTLETYTIPLAVVQRTAEETLMPLGRHPTTGAVVIKWLLECGHDVTVTNFDGFRTTHYYNEWTDWDERGARNFHRADLEEKWLRALDARGSVKLQHCYEI